MDEPVLIVGAGPVGLTLALALRRQGVALRIVDKAAARTDKSKALVIWPRTLELLDIHGCAQLVVDAYETLTAEGIPARVVSMPSWEIFDRQDADYRESVLPTGVPRVAVEAGIAMPWHAVGCARYGMKCWPCPSPSVTRTAPGWRGCWRPACSPPARNG